MTDEEKIVIKLRLDKCLKTSFIFPIAEFERVFGYIWGDGKNASELTESEVRFKQMFEVMRKNILDNGNNQIRFMDKFLKEGI